MSKISELIDLAGGHATLAEKLGISRQAVYKWESEDRIPAERVLELEGVVNRQITRYELRPDLYPRERV